MGEALDINHGLCHIAQMDIHNGDYEECADCDVIVVTAGLNRRPGETRLDLAAKNISIAKEITDSIMKHYQNSVILVVANPADILTYFIQQWSGLPAGKVFGSGTSLDSARFRYYLAQKLKVDVANVHGYVIGEHGDAQIPLWSATQIAGQTVDEFCHSMGITFTAQDKAEIASKTKTGGADVIKLKGATYFAIAGTIENIVEAVIKDKSSIKTVASLVNGPYGITDVSLSLPSIINRQGVAKIMDYTLSPEESLELKSCADKMKAFIAEVKTLL
jgi:L-lactate dehydrogenase